MRGVIRSGQSLEMYADRRAIFLAGPTPRSNAVPSWRPEAIRLIGERDEMQEYRIFVPEPFLGNKDRQRGWEYSCLRNAPCILFWIPRDLVTLPGYTTNLEFGMWVRSKKLVLGYPEDAPKLGSVQWYAKQHDVPIAHTLQGTVDLAFEILEASWEKP